MLHLVHARPVLGLALLVLVGIECDCASKENGNAPPADQVIINPDYLLLYRIADSADDTHRTPITDREGKTWYRSREPVIDLSWCRTDTVRINRSTENEGCWVTLRLRPEYVVPFFDWTEEHIGSYAGWVVDGELVSTGPVEGPVHANFGIFVSSVNEALEVEEAIRRGGVPSEPETRPASQPVETSASKPTRYETSASKPTE